MILSISRQYLTNPVSRPALRDAHKFRLRGVSAVVMHWTANEGRGANAMANRNYFNMGSRPASAHYIVDDHSIVQCLPDNEVAFHVGAKKYQPAGRAIMGASGLNPNYWTIGIEMCVNKDGDWDKTYENSVRLAAWLLMRHVTNPPHLLRHFDITGKDCPRMLLDPWPWKFFRAEVEDAAAEIAKQVRWRGLSTVENLNVRSGPGMEYAAISRLSLNEPALVLDESGNWCQIEPGGWVHRQYLKRTGILGPFHVNETT